MKQETILEAQEHCNALMKLQGVRVKIAFVVVKYLVSGNWCNESEGPKKMLILYVGPNSLLDDEESLLLSLKLAEGKGFVHEAIRDLLKKEFHILEAPLELKDHLRCITVFHSPFNGTDKATK